MADTPLFQVGGLASGLDTAVDHRRPHQDRAAAAGHPAHPADRFQDAGLGDRPAGRQDPGAADGGEGAVDERRGRHEDDDRQHRLHRDAQLADAGGQLPGLGAVDGHRGAVAHRRLHARRQRQHHGQGRHAHADRPGQDLRPDHDHRRREPGRRRGRHPRAGRAGQRGRAQRRHDRSYLSVTDLDTGFTGADNSTALQISENSTGHAGPVARLRAGGQRRAATRSSPSTGCSSPARATPSPTRSPARR